MANIKKYKNIHLIDHPLIKHKVTVMRDIKTGTSSFRRLIKEVAILESYEAFKEIPTEEVEISTPLEKTKQPKISGKKFCFIPISRGGYGMMQGLIELVPTAKVGQIEISRDPITNEIHEHYGKLPRGIEKRHIYICDPMLATGESIIEAIRLLRKNGAKNIVVISIIASPEGIKNFAHNFPEIPLYIAAIDRELDKNKNILPGLGNAGDRIFGTD